MYRIGRGLTDLEPWIEKLILNYGTPIPPDWTVKAAVLGVSDLTESQDETDGSCIVFLSDGAVFIPAVLTTQAWTRLQDLEEREDYGGLKNAIVCVRNLQLKFFMVPELARCQFYVTVNQISTVGQKSSHNSVYNCATLPSIAEQIHKTWRSRLDEHSPRSQSQDGLTNLLEEWEKYVETEVVTPDVIDRPSPLSEPTTSHHNVNPPPGAGTSQHNMSPPTETSISHHTVNSPAEPSTSHLSAAPPTSSQQPQSLEEDGEESEEKRLLRSIISRLALPADDDDVTTPTQWDRDRLIYKAEECFSVPVCHLLIPEDQREKMIALATAPSTSCSAFSGLDPPPSDKQTDEPVTTQNEVPDQLPSSGDRTDDSPRSSSVFVDAESVPEGGAWDIFAPVVDVLKSPSSSEISATPEDVSFRQTQSASVMPENLSLLQSQSVTAQNLPLRDSATPENLLLRDIQSDPATPENLLKDIQSDSETPENLPLRKIVSNSATPENILPIQSQSASAIPEKLPVLQGLTSLRSPENHRHRDSQSGSTSQEKFPLHQSLLSRLNSAPVGTSTQNGSSNGSGAENPGATLPPYQPPFLTCTSPSQSSGKRSTPHPTPEENECSKVARSPPSWIALTQQAGSNRSEGGSEPKRPTFVSPPKQSWIHPDGSAFSYKYQTSLQNRIDLGHFTVPVEMIQWSMRYLLASSNTSTEEG